MSALGRTIGTLEDGTPFEVLRERRCSRCRGWVSETTIAHGGLLEELCTGHGCGAARVRVTVAQRLTRPDRDGRPRFNTAIYLAPTAAQRLEATTLAQGVPNV